jgi:hypothetical protein
VIRPIDVRPVPEDDGLTKEIIGAARGPKRRKRK